MASVSSNEKEDLFLESLQKVEVPILTLDNKWYKLLDQVGKEKVRPLEDQLNELLKRQGKVNTETKEIKKIKKKLMEEIVGLADGEHSSDQEARIAEKKRLLEECNQRLEEYSDDMLEIPREIEAVNKRLMLITMEHCYDTLQAYTDEIESLEEWVRQIRIQLKKNLIKKQDMESKNNEIYSYMHDVFGPDVVDLFDMRYNPEDHYPNIKND